MYFQRRIGNEEDGNYLQLDEQVFNSCDNRP